METLEIKISKMNYLNFKSDIKKLAEMQKFYRSQRKDIAPDKRKISSKDATYEHQHNKLKLRIMYAAYGLLRGKSFSQTESHYPEENHPLMKYQFEIDRIISKYSIEEK